MDKVKAQLGEVASKAKAAMSEIKANFRADECTTGVRKIQSMFVNLWKCGIVGKSALIAAVAVIVLLPWVFGSGVDSSDPKSVAEYAWKALLKGDAEKLSALVGKKFTQAQEIEYEAFANINNDSYHYESCEVKDVKLWEKACRILLDCKTRYADDTVVIFLSRTDPSTWSLAGAASVKCGNFTKSFDVAPWTDEFMKSHIDDLRAQLRRAQ